MVVCVGVLPREISPGGPPLPLSEEATKPPMGNSRKGQAVNYGMAGYNYGIAQHIAQGLTRGPGERSHS